MISVDCSQALAIKDQILVHVADKLAVLPILKSEKFLLTPLDDAKKKEKSDVLSAISEYLESVNLKENFQIIPKGDDIKLEPLGGKNMKEKLAKIPNSNKEMFFECTHCGFMTRYETEWRSHKLVHYI